MKSFQYFFLFISFIFLFMACQENDKNKENSLPEGIWRATLNQEGAVLPFNFELKYKENDTLPEIVLLNGEEEIVLDQISKLGNKFTIPMHIFEGEIIASWNGSKLVGKWYRRSFDNSSSLDFEAEPNNQNRFEVQSSEPVDVSGKWETHFLRGTDSTAALGVFETSNLENVNGNLKGTFLTKTGDYRYLYGSTTEDSLFLSCFDGSHAFLFKAKMQDENTMEGQFWSGKAEPRKFVAKRNASFELPDAGTLTYLKEGYETIAFTFPNLEGDTTSLESSEYQGKVRIVQLLGSWCPNCMDESMFLAELHKNYQSQGLEIIGLAYEQTEDFEVAKKRIERMKERLGVDYEILFAGRADKKFAAQSLPMLNHVMSFPTTIFVDKEGKVRKIHTGFSGAGTGKYYQEFVEETTTFVEKLLSE